jgi:hypothetical protein
MGLDQYGMIGVKTEKRTDTDTGKEYTVKMADQEFYWRKHARLQDLWKNCGLKKLADQMLSLIVMIWCLPNLILTRLEKAVLTGYAENISEGGFFYGHQFQEECGK